MSDSDERWCTALGQQLLRQLDAVISSTDGRKHDSPLRVQLLEMLDSLPDREMSIEIKRRLNANSILIRLPNEILRAIIAATASVWPLSVGSICCDIELSGPDATLGWIALSHTCYMLRFTILDYPSLWAQFASVFSRGQDEFLRRAGRCGVTFETGDVRCLHTPMRVNFLLSHLQQAREIIVRDYEAPQSDSHGNPIPLFDKWPLHPSAFAGLDLPLLERMELLFGVNSQHGLGEAITEDVFALPPLHATQFTSLYLENSYIPFNGNTLTVLKLYRTSDHALPSPLQFLEMLRSCNQLQTLELWRWIPFLPFAAEPTVTLPALMFLLTYTNTIDIGVAFWSHIIINPRARCRLTAVGSSEDEITDARYVDFFQRHFQSDASPPLYGMGIVQVWSYSVSLAFFSNPVDDWFRVFGEEIEPHLTLRFMLTQNPIPTATFLRAAHSTMGAFDFSRARYLQINRELTSQDVDWAHTLHPFSRVSALQVVRFSRALLETLCSPDVLVSLRHLWVENLIVGYGSEITQAEFCRLFIERKKMGVPLESLSINYLYMGEDAGPERVQSFLGLLRIIPLEVNRRGNNSNSAGRRWWA